MSQASAVRLAHALPLAFGLAFVWPEAADAGLYVPAPMPEVETSATMPPALPRPCVAPAGPHASAAAVDADGRNLSISVPPRVQLYGLARAERVSARTVFAPTPAGGAQIALALDRPVDDDVGTAGAFVGVIQLSIDYN